MKKRIKMLLLFILIIISTGCDNVIIGNDTMENINIYTSIYPIEYATKRIYGNYAKVNNMYPAGTNPYKYNFTDKQIENFSSSGLVIYNGLTDERNKVVDMLNKNRNLKIIDATARIEYSHDIDEIWMNPSNILTISQNIKTGLKEYITSKYLKDAIDKNYEELKLELSRLDADIKDDIENANYKEIVAASDSIKILEKYGLKVRSLDSKSINDKEYDEIKKLINNESIKYIYTSSITKESKYFKELKETYPNIEIIELNTLNNISDDDKKNNKDYLTIMNENRDKLKKELYK